MSSNSIAACIFESLLCFVLAIQGSSMQEADNCILTMEPERYLHVNADNVSEVNVLCTLRDAAGSAAALAGCEFREYYGNMTWEFNEGPASPNTTESDGHHGRYHGRGLNHGECGLTLAGYKNNYGYILGCRVRPALGKAWRYAAMMLDVNRYTQMQYRLHPPGVTLARAGSDVSLDGEAEHAVDLCYFVVPPAVNVNLFDFSLGQASAKHSNARYHGSGLNNKQCGVTLINVQPETSGFVRGNTFGSSFDAYDFVELIVATPPDAHGIRNTPTNREGTLNATCWSKKSRPVANITWIFDGKVIRQDSINDEPAETEWLWNHDPQSITQHLLLNVTQEDNGKQLLCQVEHMALPSGIANISTVVNFIYKPVFDLPQSNQQINDVGQPFTLVVNATANPPDINYTWTKDSVDNVTVAKGPVLNFTRLGIDDSGWYTCTAVNSVGSAAWTFQLTVIGPPHISHDLTIRYIIEGVTCVLLISALGVIVILIRFYRCPYYSGGSHAVSHEMERLDYDHTLALQPSE